MEKIKQAWRGQEKLWIVFWIYGVVVGILFQILLGILGAQGMLFVGLAVYVVYYVWVIVSTWRCAFNVKARSWGYVARVLAILSVIGMVLSVLMMGGLMATVGTKGAKNIVNGAMVCGQMLEKQAAALGMDAKTFNKQQPQFMRSCMQQMMGQAPVEYTPTQTVLPANYGSECEKRMAEYAVQNNTDPKAYIAKNQEYLKRCNETMQGAEGK